MISTTNNLCENVALNEKGLHMNIQNNAKYVETHKKIIAAFLSELEKTSIDKIKVSTICQKIQINRSTFYAHFEDIYDILKTLSSQLGEEMYRMFEKSTDKKSSRILKASELYQYIAFIYEHRDFYKIYFSSIPLDHIDINLEKIFSELIYPILIDRGESDTATGLYYCTFFKNGLFSVIKQWLIHDCDKTPLEITQIILKGINYTSKS